MSDFTCKYCGVREPHDRRVCCMKRRNADPEFKARITAGRRRCHACDPAGLSEDGRTEYDAARSEGFGHADAERMAGPDDRDGPFGGGAS